LSSLRRILPACPGIWVEDKGFALAFHYRRVGDEGGALACLRAWLASHGDLLEGLGLEVLAGKKVLEIKPKGADKGQAVLRLWARHPHHIPVYIGDDTTDEMAFQALKGKGLTFKVGPGPTLAEGRLEDVGAVLAYLKSYL
ncbi:MAG: trehalose-phosphatase, partial [Thermus sp.]|nr:trehalose-phosphatase [Thermus sp.]